MPIRFTTNKNKTPMMEGLPIRDAKKSATFVITKRDIKGSKPMDPAHCAAAVACQRIFKAREVRVHLSVTYVRFADHWERYITPEAIAREIISFDRTKYFDPGEYQLKAPDPSRQLGAHKKTGPHTNGGSPRKKNYVHITAHVRRGSPTPAQTKG